MGILSSEKMKELILELKQRYDFVFFDSPPLLGVSDASILASEMDMVIQVVQYRRADFGPIPFSVTADHSREVFAVMKARLSPDAVVLTRKPTIIALFTGRRAAVWPAPFREAEVWAYARQIGASYVLQGPLDYGLNGSRPDDFDAFIERNQARLHPIFTNPWFRLYQMTAPPEPAATARAGPDGRD